MRGLNVPRRVHEVGERAHELALRERALGPGDRWLDDILRTTRGTMAERKKKGVVAPKYQQTVSRATPQAITALVKKLPAEAGPIEARKKALYDLTLMISNVTQQDQDALLKTSEEHNLVGILATLLKDAEEAERERELTFSTGPTTRSCSATCPS